MILVLLPPSENCIRVGCVALCQATTLRMYRLLEKRYKAKALVIDNTLLEVCSASTTLLAGLLIVLVFVVTKVLALVTKPRPTHHTSQCVIRAYTNAWS